MFDFFKKKKNEEDAFVQTASGFAATESAKISIDAASTKYAKPQNYDRVLYDKGTAKKKAKMDLFKNSDTVKVIDPYTEKELVLTKAEAKIRFGDKWAEHLAEADHTIPLERIYEENKNNPWVTNDNISDVANSEDNINVTSRKFNNTKRKRKNSEFVNDDEYLEEKGIELSTEGKKKAINDEKKAEKYIKKQLKKNTTKNILKTGHEAGVNASIQSGVTALTMNTIMNFVSVIKGEKNAKEALSDTAGSTGKAVVSGYAMGNGLTVVSHSLSNSSSKFVQALVKSNVPGKVITAVLVTGDTLKKYAKGEITTEECIIGLGENGLTFATAGYSMAVGQALIPIPIVGGAIGALVGTVLTSNYYHSLIDSLKNKQLEHQERVRIIAECEAAKKQTINFKIELQKYLDSYFQNYKDCFDEALSEIDYAFEVGDADGVILGANKITRQLNGNVYYESVDQFKSFLGDDSTDYL